MCQQVLYTVNTNLTVYGLALELELGGILYMEGWLRGKFLLKIF
jgi:hypothetical protein